jgi:hypothetical protein
MVSTVVRGGERYFEILELGNFEIEVLKRNFKISQFQISQSYLSFSAFHSV